MGIPIRALELTQSMGQRCEFQVIYNGTIIVARTQLAAGPGAEGVHRAVLGDDRAVVQLAPAAPCRGTWARINIDHFRQLAPQNRAGQRASTSIISPVRPRPPPHETCVALVDGSASICATGTQSRTMRPVTWSSPSVRSPCRFRNSGT